MSGAFMHPAEAAAEAYLSTRPPCQAPDCEDTANTFADLDGWPDAPVCDLHALPACWTGGCNEPGEYTTQLKTANGTAYGKPRARCPEHDEELLEWWAAVQRRAESPAVAGAILDILEGAGDKVREMAAAR